jgi:hypothetical protein
MDWIRKHTFFGDLLTIERMRFQPLCFDYHAEATNLLREAREETTKIWIHRSCEDSDDREDESELDEDDDHSSRSKEKMPGLASREMRQKALNVSLPAPEFLTAQSDSSVRYSERCQNDRAFRVDASHLLS